MYFVSLYQSCRPPAGNSDEALNIMSAADVLTNRLLALNFSHSRAVLLNAELFSSCQ